MEGQVGLKAELSLCFILHPSLSSFLVLSPGWKTTEHAIIWAALIFLAICAWKSIDPIERRLALGAIPGVASAYCASRSWVKRTPPAASPPVASPPSPPVASGTGSGLAPRELLVQWLTGRNS